MAIIKLYIHFFAYHLITAMGAHIYRAMFLGAPCSAAA